MWQNLQVRYVLVGATEVKSDPEDDGAGGKDVHMRREGFRRWEGKRDASEVGGIRGLVGGPGSCIRSLEMGPGGPAPNLRTFGLLEVTPRSGVVRVCVLNE
jgi:hypothetical protein